MSEVTGKITGIFVGKQNGGGKTKVSSAELIAGHGVSGDSHAGRDSKRHVSLFTQEILEQLLAEGFTFTPGALSANLFTADIKLDSLKPGVRLRVGETLLEIVEARKPCRSITRIDNRLPKRLYGQCGQLACIIEGGNVKVGDEVEIVADQRQMSFGF